MPKLSSLGTRWLGVGLAAILSVVTLSLSFTGRLGLYINPDSTWFAVGMSLVLLVGSALSFALPLGAEADHGHDHGDEPAPHAHDHDHAHAQRPQSVTFGERAGFAATVVGGAAASGVVLLTLFLPPASLSAELAISRDVGAPPLFAGSDAVTLAATGDTSSFGVGDWATVFATATNPDAFDGDTVTLTGFVTPATADGGFALTRLVITHCVIDAQPASLPIAATGSAPETGQWVTITGTVASTSDGKLSIDATSVEAIDEPADPYEY